MPPTLPLSVLLLARDEAARLDALLPTLAFARDVVVVVDAVTRDDSRAVAERHGARVFVRALDGFGSQRRFALEQCREPWVLWLDADERLPADAASRLAPLLERTDVIGFDMPRRTWFLGKPIRWCGWQNERVRRLFRRDRARFDDTPIHESVRLDGPEGRADLVIEHHSYETWEDCRRKLLLYSGANARRRDARASILDVAFRPGLRFLRMYVLQLGVLDGVRGFLVCGLAATQVFLKYAQRLATGIQRPGPPKSRADS